MNMIRDVSMVEFWSARFMTERNHEIISKDKKVKNPLVLEAHEICTLAKLNSKAELTHDELVLNQKLAIKEAIYNGVNSGAYLNVIDLVVPLEQEVKTWSRSFGYALSAKTNTIWVEMDNGWQYADTNSSTPSKTSFTVLW